jgi:hypothetical protein
MKWPSLQKSVSKFKPKDFKVIDPMLERLSREKHSCLFQKFVNYSRKKLYNIGPWNALKYKESNT